MAMDKLLQIMTLLRDPEFGCAWDLKQNFQSIAPHTLEEVYEVIDCIEDEDYEHLPNELGDLLFQVIFYAQVGKEAGLFDFNDVVNEICEKLLTRHPHVFPTASIESFGRKNTLTPEEVEVKWEEIKKQEALKKPISPEAASTLDNIPKAFPALLKAKKIQKKAASVGFDWDNIQSVLDKVKEEIQELEEAIEENDESHIKEEFGDVLFSLVNLSRHLKVDSENTLSLATKKFEKRFRLMEQELRDNNHEIANLSLAALEEHWQKAKLKLSASTKSD